MFGSIGDDTRLEYTVIGEAVNLAAKLEKATKSEAAPAVVLAATFELALAQGYVPRNPDYPRRAIRIPGADETVEVVLVGS